MYNYEVILYWSDIDNAFIAEVPELSGCMADGKTRLEAIQNVEVIISEWIEKFLPRHHVGLYSIKEQITPDRPITLALPIAALFGGGR